MKTRNNHAKCGIFIAALTLFGTSCTSQMSQSVNDETAGLNGGFEHVKEGLPVNWLCYTPQTTGFGKFSIYPNLNDKIEGKQSLSIDVQTCSDQGGRFSPGLAKEFDVTPGETYVITFKVKQTETLSKITLQAISAFQQSAEKAIHLNQPITQWQTYSLTYQVPDDMKKLRLEINVLKPGLFQLDDVVISLKSQPKS